MNAIIKLADRLYILLLRLHPLAGVSDFYEEMYATYAQVIDESSSRGVKMLWQRILRELFDLPGVIIRSWIFGRKAMTENPSLDDKSSPPTPWRTALISLLPFVWIGPVMIALSYLPFWRDPQWNQWLWPGETIMIGIIFWIGIVVGVKQGFPRWSFPYVMGGIIFLSTLVNSFLRYSPLRNMSLLWLLVSAAAWTAAVILWRPYRLFWSHIRQDWTSLSYCTFTLTLVFMGAVDHDETPRLTMLVLLPSLLTLAGAFFHLRATTRTGRILALVVSLTLALPIHILPLLDGRWDSPSMRAEVLGLLFSAYFLLLAFLLAPALVGLVKRAETSTETLN